MNEESNIDRCLRSLDWADEIVVVDSGSSDRTIEICRNYTDRILHREFDSYIRQKNFAADHARNQWIFNIDADEEVSDPLREKITKTAVSGPGQKKAFSANRLTQYCGKWIRHSGWYPDRQTRLYDRESCAWCGDLIHERLKVEGASGHLDADLLHYSFPGISDHFTTADRFTRIGAEELRKSGIRKRLPHICLRTLFTFLKIYVLKKGFLDGWQGFSIAGFSAFSVYVKYLRVREVEE